MKKHLLITILITAATQVLAQNWTQLNDSTFVRHTLTNSGIVTDYAAPISSYELASQLSRDIAFYADCQIAEVCLFSAATASGLWTAYNVRHNRNITAPAIVTSAFLISGFIVNVVGLHRLSSNRVQFSPGGIALRITRTDKPINKQKAVFKSHQKYLDQ